jgi:hypothetical protein
MEMSVPEDQARIMSNKMAGEAVRKKIGRESVNGYVCDKYEVTVINRSGARNIFYQWISDDKVPVKTEAKDGSWSTELKNFQFTSQPPALFELPAGYHKQSMPDMGKMKGAGKMPVDLEKMMKGMPGR